MTPFVECMVWFLGISAAAELGWKGYKWRRDRDPSVSVVDELRECLNSNKEILEEEKKK